MKATQSFAQSSSRNRFLFSSREECSNPSGWNLQGSDWGCCGNYDGCCTYASFLCYIHDALCRCCDAGDSDFCGPTCQPEPDCVTPSTVTPCQQETDCMTASAELPCKPEVGCQASSGSKFIPIPDEKRRPYKDNELFKQGGTFKNNSTSKHFAVDGLKNFTSGKSLSERFPSSQTKQAVTQSISNTQTVPYSFTNGESVTERENAESERTSHTVNEDSLSDGSGDTEYRPFV